MRPDKKKKVHHDSVVKKKAALEKEAKKTGKEKENSNPPESPEESGEAAPPSAAPAPLAPPTFKGVRETGDKLITEANQRYLAAQTKEEEPKYAKRNITSNWTKFELPSSGDESGDETLENMTGADFNYVLASASGAESHFRLKSEKEWDPDSVVSGGEFSNEFFSLDVMELERCLNCVPFPKHIGVKEDDFEADNLSFYKSKAARCVAAYDEASPLDVEKEISQKIMDILVVEKEKSPPEVVPRVEVKKETLVFPKPEVSMSLEERPTKKLENSPVSENPQKSDESECLSKEEIIKKSLNSAPLEQRAGRRQRGAKKGEASDMKVKDTIDSKKEEDENKSEDKPNNETDNLKDKTTPKLIIDDSTSKVKSPTNSLKDESSLKSASDEKSDLDFLDSIDKPKQDKDTPEEEKVGVVPVKIVKEQETANLEDWLDDFLDE